MDDAEEFVSGLYMESYDGVAVLFDAATIYVFVRENTRASSGQTLNQQLLTEIGLGTKFKRSVDGVLVGWDLDDGCIVEYQSPIHCKQCYADWLRSFKSLVS